VLFFTGTLFPALGFVNVYPMRYSFVADHFQYLAAIGLIVLIAAGLSRFSKFTAVILLPLMVLTWRQQHIYYDAQTLWENTIAQNETCWMAHTNLAGTLRSQKQLEAAMQQSKRALELAPSEADTHYDYGVALARASRWNDAIAEFRSAIACDPQCAVAFSDLGRVLWDHDDSATAQAEAYAAAKRAIEINPNLADPHYVFACVAELSGNLPNAIDEYQKALEIEPEDFHSHFNLGLCLLQTGQFGEAAGEFQKVVNHDPGNAPAWNYLGDAYVRAGKTAEAAGFYRRALSIDPSLPSARQALEKRHAE
jgi:tetratricopeptide (TPR) repeat protein